MTTNIAAMTSFAAKNTFKRSENDKSLNRIFYFFFKFAIFLLLTRSYGNIIKHNLL